MAKLVVGTRSFDMTDWDLSDLAGGTSTLESATEADVTGAAFRWVITGTGLGSYDANGVPHSGTVTGITMGPAGKVPLAITGISIDAASFAGFVGSNNANSLEAAIFSGDDTFQGRPSSDTLLGFGGNDTFLLAHSGADNAQGGDGNDTFKMGAALDYHDTISGGAGSDTVILDGDYPDPGFSSLTLDSVETVVLRPGHDYILQFGGATDTAGQSMTITAGGLGSGNTIDIEAASLAGDMKITGGAGNDYLTGGTGANTIAGGAGSDQINFNTGVTTASGGDGDDGVAVTSSTFWTAGDFFNGGQGNDYIILDGDFSAGLTFDSTDIKNVENFTLGRGLSFAPTHYNLTIDTSAFHRPAGLTQIYTIDAFGLQLSGHDTVNLTLKPGADNIDAVQASWGDDTIHIDFSAGGAASFDMREGGDDTIIGSGTGDNGNTFSVNYGSTLTADDIATDANLLSLDGDYSAGVAFNAASTFTGLSLAAGNSYNLTISDANVPDSLRINAVGPNASTSLTVHAETVTHNIWVTSLASHDSLFLGSGDDLVQSDASTVTTVSAGGGNDQISVFDFNAGDFIDGGSGNDVLNFTGTTGVVRISSAMIQNVEQIGFSGSEGAISVVVTDNLVASGQTMTVNMGDDAHFDGSKETTGSFHITHSVHHGVMAGGANSDFIQDVSGGASMTGNGGTDQLIGDAGRDHIDSFIYKAVTDSTSTGYDTVSLFSVTDNSTGDPDIFEMGYAVTGVDAAVNAGALSTASFDSDLAAAVGSAQLGVHHAVVFTASSGTLAGDNFLIVDANGVAGYQAGQDYVMLLNGAVGLASLSTANFA